MKKYQITGLIIWFAFAGFTQTIDKNANRMVSEVTIHPGKYKQTVWGIGFEIQSDAIGSGNTGLPEDRHAVPHDLTPAERERLAKEMLAGPS